MYYILFLLLILALFCSIFLSFRRKKSIQKIKCMETCEKCTLTNELINSFGYHYHCFPGIFSSTQDAWQRNMGYTYLYDYMAPRFQMVYDSLPVYFDYRGKTWLIQFWKGQYGINTGAEIGIYHADTIISPEDYKSTLFTAVEESEMLPLSFRLFYKDNTCIEMAQTHWWLTSFDVGIFTEPYELATDNSITFPNCEMLHAFVKGLLDAGVNPDNVSVCRSCVYFYFDKSPETTINLFTRFWRRISQWNNKNFCKLYLWFTKPFSTTEDRILYLYYYLPFVFRKILRLHRFDKHCHRKQHCMKKRKADQLNSSQNKNASAK